MKKLEQLADLGLAIVLVFLVGVLTALVPWLGILIMIGFVIKTIEILNN